MPTAYGFIQHQYNIAKISIVTRINFQHKLDGLKEQLLVMAGLVEQAVQRATDAYTQRDLRLCAMVHDSEARVNRMEREVDEMALDLLAMEQPMAVDLRFIMAVTRINADLERVGDQAVNIANRVEDLVMLPRVELPVDIPRLAQLSSAMVRSALQSFIEGDADSAEAVLRMDEQVDDMNRAAYRALTGVIQSRPEVTPQALAALIISRNLERVGDHATNVAEDVIFWVRGSDVRHHELLARA
jgi:phosphate transport system protein